MKLYRTAQQQLVEAARATKQLGGSREYKRGRNIAQEFLRSTYMGQTKVGSYIVSALTPTNNVLARIDEGNTNEDKLFAEATKTLTNGHVIDTLSRSLVALEASVSAYKRSRRPEVFEETIGAGVSRGLVKSIRECIEGSELEILIVQSRREKLPPSKVWFGPDEENPLRSLEHYLTYEIVERKGAFVGQVELLQRKDGSRIRFRTDIDGSNRTVQVELTPEQYLVALEAHARLSPVIIRGRLRAFRDTLPTITEVLYVEPVIQDDLFPST